MLANYNPYLRSCCKCSVVFRYDGAFIESRGWLCNEHLKEYNSNLNKQLTLCLE